MTIENTTVLSRFTGNGVTTAFATGFAFFDAADVQVYFGDVLQTSGYTVTGGAGETGTVTFTIAPAAATAITLVRALPYIQTTDYTEITDFPAESHEDALDRAAMRDQQLAESVGRSLKVKVTQQNFNPAVTVTGNTVLGFNTAGTALKNYSAADLAIFLSDELGDLGGSIALQTASIVPSKGTASIPLVNILTPKYNPKNYTGFVGDGVNSDQVAIDAMMADIAADVGTRRFIAIELPNENAVRGQIKKIATSAADTWRNVYIDGNNSELIANTKPASLGGASPLAGDGILHLQYIDGLTIRNLRVNGLCYNTITALTQSAGVATCTTAETHNLVTGEYLPIMDVLAPSGVDALQRMRDDTYNGAKFITVTGANTFTFPVHPNASATPDITYAKCGFKNTQFGGDNIRLVSCTRVIMSDIDSRHGNDHGIYFVSTTNSANTTDATLSLNDNNILVSNLYLENVTQTSSTPSGVREMVWSNVLARYFRGGAVKFASHLINGEVQISNLQCFDFSNVGNATTPNGFIIEGGQRMYLDGFNFARAGGVILLPNPTSGRPGQKILKDVTVQNGTITDCGYCYLQTRRRENHAVIVGDNSVTVGSDSVNNITLRNIDIIRPMGKAFQLGNNNAGTLKNVQIIGGSVRDPALQAVSANARNMNNPVIRDVTISKSAAAGSAATSYAQNWGSGTSYTLGDVVYVASNNIYYRKNSSGSHVSTIEPSVTNANTLLADGCIWKSMLPNSAILVGPIEGMATDFADDAVIKGNNIEVWADGFGIDLTKCRRAIAEDNTLNSVGIFSINLNSTQNSNINKNTVKQAGANALNSGNNLDMTVQNNYFDANNNNRVCANFNNDDGLLYTGNTHANSAANISPMGTTLNNIRRVRAYGNFSFNCLRGDRLAPQIAARRRNLDGSFFEYKHEVGLSNNDAVMLTAGAFIENSDPAPGEHSRLYVTAGGFNARQQMQSNLSATGLGGAFFSTTTLTSGAFTGAPAAWNWTGRQPVYQVVADNGAGTPTSGAAAVPADYFGIPDGATINSCGHWLWLSWNDFGYPLMANGESVGYETGKASDAFVNARQSGTVITAMSYDSGTGVVTCTATGHGLTNGEFYTIARCWPTAFQVNADANTDGVKDSNPVTVLDPNTFTYTVATGLTQGPVMGIALVKPNGTSQGNCSITRSGTTATLTATSHGLTTGNSISVRMATDDLYNVTSVTCTVIDANTLTYTMTGTPAASPAVAKDRLVLFGAYYSEAPNTRTVGAGGFTKPKTRGIPWGDYFVEFYGPRARAERLGVVPYRATVTFNPGTVNAGATFNSADQTLTGITARMTGRATSLDTAAAGLEARVAIVGANTYRIVLYNATAGNLTPGNLTFEVEVFNTLPWSIAEIVV